MQDSPRLNDPQLAALAERLAARPPGLPAGERDALLFECGVAAGRRAEAGSARRWRIAAACLALVAGGLGVYSTRHTTQRGGVQVVVTPQAAPGPLPVRPMNDEPARRSIVRASTSWEQAEAILEARSKNATERISALPPTSGDPVRLSVGTARRHRELWE